MKKISIFIIILVIILISILTFFIFFNNKGAKKYKIGNNSSSQEIVDYILNISSYEAEIEVEVKSNKNENKYKIKQQYKKDEINNQEVIEPTNIQGVKIIKSQEGLKIENSKLNLSTVFEKYNYVADNVLDLETFIGNYKNSPKSTYEEKNDKIIMSTVDDKNERNTKNKVLYIDKSTGKPLKMEIKDNNNNSTIYIKYIEVDVNSLN